jgi:hypothetical protein
LWKEENLLATEGSLFKSQQMLKKCINDQAHMREKGGATLPAREILKLAAPKPIKAR